MSKISKSIKKFRTAAGLTQSELSEKMFVSRQTISSWENGRTQPDIDSLTKLSQTLCISVEELIYGEKPKLTEDVRNDKARKTIITIFSVVASLLVAVGGVLIFTNYWSEFPLSLQTAFSILPMLIGQAAGVYVFTKKREKPHWREGASVLWCAGIAATVALCDSVLSLSTDFSACLLIDALLFLTVIYVLDAVAPLIVYYTLSVTYGVLLLEDRWGETDFHNLFCVGVIFALISLGAVYVFLHRKETEDARRAFAGWVTVLALTAASVVTAFVCEEMFFTPFIAALMLIYSMKCKGVLSLPCRTLMPIGLAAASFFLSYALSPGIYPDDYNSLDMSSLIIIALSVIVAIAATVILLKTNSFGKVGVIYVLSIASMFLVSIICVGTRFEGELISFIISYVLVMAQGVSLVVIGAKENKFLPLNVGLITIIALIMEILFAGDIDILILGFIMVFFGVCLFVINYKLSRKGKKEGQKNEQEQ